MKFRTTTRKAKVLLVSSFVLFYTTVEIMLFANRQIFGAGVIGNDLVMLLISFLNIVPSGIFAFAVVSALPPNNEQEYSESELMSRTPIVKPRVALIYTTYNDFIEEDASYNYEQARMLSAPFFILDDSNRDRKKKEVEAFAADREACILLRRKSRAGFKAGAVNNWLELYGKQFDYFFILDSDSRASYDAIQYTLELARRDLSIALVQTNTLTMTTNPTNYTKSAITVQHAYMAVVQNSMKNLGSSPYYGHNALIKVEALRSVGGFIEESNEDYKTLARFHHGGYRSIYASKATTWEETPPDYFSGRKRSLRWSRDAVGQLGLLRFRLPLPMVIYLFYGWVTYMTNIALLAFFILMATGTLSLQVSNMGIFGAVAGVVTVSVVTLWPLLALRIKDPELNVRTLARAMACGTPFNLPMMGPVSLQIVRTTASEIVRHTKSALGLNQGKPEDFIVTPKIKATSFGLSSVLSNLKLEILLGLIPITVALITSALSYLVFSIPQDVSLVLLPMLILAESRSRVRTPKLRHRPASAKDYAKSYAGVSNLEGAPQYAYLRMH